jgi:hypothetical protein
MVSTQLLVLDAGIHDTLMPLVVKELVAGSGWSGWYGFAFGFIVACRHIGHGCSMLLAQSLLSVEAGGSEDCEAGTQPDGPCPRYDVAFAVLGSMGLLVSALLADAQIDDDKSATGDGVEKVDAGGPQSQP